MPRYDFHCPACGRTFEIARSFAAASDPAHCPDDGAQASRVFSAPLFYSSSQALVSKPAPIHHDHDSGHHDHKH